MTRPWIAPDCGFCHGEPVHNAAAWTWVGTKPYVPCPRCGRECTDEEIATYERGVRS
jgi:hypothetical protein